MIKSSIEYLLTNVRNIEENSSFAFVTKYWTLCLLFLLVCISGVILIIFLNMPSNVFGNNKSESSSISKTKTFNFSNDIYVDLSGSINKPGVYKVPPTAHIYEALELAGGLTEQADEEFINRNINFAQTLADGQKVYFPSKNEVINKIYVENQKILSQVNSTTSPDQGADLTVVSINTSSAGEIESLPGIGEVTREKIIKGRPYKSLDDLVLRGIVNQSVFNKIQDSIAL